MLNINAKCIFAAVIATALLPAATVSPNDRYFPFVMDGGGWKSIITVTNLDRDPALFQMNLNPGTSLGDNWGLEVTGDGIRVQSDGILGTIPGGGSITITTPGAADQLSIGYGQVFSISGQKLAASITLRYSQPEHTPAETTMPMTAALERKFVLPFDHTNGGGTRIALVSETVGASVSVIIRDEKSNIILSDKLILSDEKNPSQLILNLGARYPQLVELRGTVECSVVFPLAGRYDELTFTGIALHSNSNGTLSAVQTQTAADWQ